MSKPIYKITSKKVTALLVTEVKRKDKFINAFNRNIKKIVPGAAGVAYGEDSWSGRVRPYGIVFKKGEEVDLKEWKPMSYVIYKGDRVMTYYPKKTTKIQKEFEKKIHRALEHGTFFKHPELADLLKYKPAKRSEVKGGILTSNSLSFGMKKVNKDYTFVFKGYDGYKAPRGVKEMYISEYNKLMQE